MNEAETRAEYIDHSLARQQLTVSQPAPARKPRKRGVKLTQTRDDRFEHIIQLGVFGCLLTGNGVLHRAIARQRYKE